MAAEGGAREGPDSEDRGLYPQRTSMISSISRRVIRPSPSRSYISKAQLSFCSKLPREVTERAQMNSRKSMVPSPFLSKVRKACCANLEASP